MTAPAPAFPPPAEQESRWAQATRVAKPLGLRWLLIAVLTVVAFHRSLLFLIRATRGETLNGYIWTVLLAGVLATIGVARRPRRELPIHDRQTDIIVGLMGLVLSVLLHGVLLQRYGTYFSLLRLDLVAMWMFVLSCCIVLFGLRPVIRYIPVWLLLLLVFPLPYHVVVILLGNGRLAAGGATLLVPLLATWICVANTRRRGMIGVGVTAAIGLGVLLAMNALVPDAPLLAYQIVPSQTALIVTAVGMFLYARRGQPIRVLDREVEPLATRQVWSAIPLLTAVAIVLSFVQLPPAATPNMVEVESMTFWTPLTVPVGWHQTDQRQYPRVAHLYGDRAELLRQEIQADIGNPKWDKLSQPRKIWIDSISTASPFTLEVYPSISLYPLPRSRLSPAHSVDLGSGVVAQMFSATDDRLLVTWNVLLWTWRNATSAQRVLMFSVDYHDDGAPLPEPGHSIPTVLNSLFVVLFRGNAAVANRAAQFKDEDMLTEVGRKLVAAQLEPLWKRS